MSKNAEQVGAIVLLALMGLAVVAVAMVLLGCGETLAATPAVTLAQTWQPNPGPWPPPNNPIVIAK